MTKNWKVVLHFREGRYPHLKLIEWNLIGRSTVLNLGKKKERRKYSIENIWFHSSPCEKDLCIFVTHGLKMNQQCNVGDKILPSLNSLKGIYSPEHWKNCPTYSSLFKPHLEYCVPFRTVKIFIYISSTEETIVGDTIAVFN